ncbi:hypothetical protein [Thermomonas carbonis]|uniref:hypothetical protein n=1 Tax=Thermomonas carbonis TaxID=1463158 RepID=UPI0019B9FAE8|nr:hypothetical protein [Thermomonas carbonis]GHC00871.1 hypothetical protein GCM10010080_12790 [Thermomonas carbonis]
MRAVAQLAGTIARHRTPDEKRRAMTGAQRLKRVFGIDVSTSTYCSGTVRIIANTTKRHRPEIPKSRAQTSDPPPNRRLCDRRLPARLA